MTVQYKANARTKSGGGGSGNSNNGDKGSIKTTLMGTKIVDRMFFQTIGDSGLSKYSPFPGKSWTSELQIELEIN